MVDEKTIFQYLIFMNFLFEEFMFFVFDIESDDESSGFSKVLDDWVKLDA